MKNKIYMKTIFKIIAFVVITINSNYAQITTSINQVFLNSQTTVTNCNTLDFGTNQNNDLVFYFKLERPQSLPSGTGTLRIMLNYNSNSSPQVIGAPQNILDSFWANTTYESTIPCTISASQVQQSGSTIYIEFETSGNIKTKSCDYPITKTPPPSFSLLPSTLSIGCGDVSQRTFTVTPANIPSGATVTYNWSHPGWNLISSTATTRTLQPSSSTSLPSNVSVTPSINGVAQASKTCTVSRAQFTDNTSSITGQTALCSTGTYTYNINNPSNHNISWTLSNSNVANIISQTNSQVIVNVNNPNGVFTINATVTNNCNQSVSKSLNCSIGAPILSFSGNPTFCKSDYQREDNSIVLNTSNFSISEFEWFTGNFVGEPIQTCALPIINTFNNKAYFQAPDLCMGTIRVRARNNCGWSEWLLIDVPVINCKDIEGPRSGDIYEFRTANPLNEKEIAFSIYPNPTSDFISIEISSFEKSKYSTEFHAEIFDFMGNKIKSFAIIESISKVNVSELKNGIYFIKIRTEKELLTYKIVKK